MIAKAWGKRRERIILGSFKEDGFHCNIDSEIIIENDSDHAALLPGNDTIEDYINFDKDLEICNQIPENWDSGILDNFVEWRASIHQKEGIDDIEDDLYIEILFYLRGLISIY